MGGLTALLPAQQVPGRVASFVNIKGNLALVPAEAGQGWSPAGRDPAGRPLRHVFEPSSRVGPISRVSR